MVKYWFFKKLPKISLIHKNCNFSSINRICSSIKGIFFFQFCQLWAIKPLVSIKIHRNTEHNSVYLPSYCAYALKCLSTSFNGLLDNLIEKPWINTYLPIRTLTYQSIQINVWPLEMFLSTQHHRSTKYWYVILYHTCNKERG